MCTILHINHSVTYAYQSIQRFLCILSNFAHLKFVISVFIKIHPGFQIMPWPFIDELNLLTSQLPFCIMKVK